MIRQAFGDLRLRVKIALMCMLVMIPGVTVSSILFYSYASESAAETINLNTKRVSSQLSGSFDARLTGILKRLIALLDNNSFDGIIRDFLVDRGPVTTAVALSTVSTALSELKNSDDFLASVLLVTPDMNFYSFADQLARDFDLERNPVWQAFSAWDGPGLYWGSRQTDRIFRDGKTVVPLGFRFTIPDYNEELAIILNLDATALGRFLDQGRLAEDRVLLLGPEGPLYGDRSPVEAKVLALLGGGQTGFEAKVEGERFLVNVHSLKVAPWQIVDIGSTQTLDRKLDTMRSFTLVLILGFTTLGVLLSLFLARGITRPIATLEQAMGRVGDTPERVRFDHPYRNEVGRLGDSFNAMVDRLEQARHQLQDEQVRKRQAELLALQAQINPHFLYNTLNTIVWMADREKAPEIGRLAGELGTFFRIGLSQGVEKIRLADELEHVRAYLEVQKFRYGEALSYTLGLAPGLSDVECHKLIVQPLVENAIYHGIKGLDRPGRICIGADPDPGAPDAVLVWVEDNGRGIAPGLRDDLNRRLELLEPSPGSGYGIFNVNERLRIAHGPGFGLTLAEGPDGGVRAVLRIPR